MANWLSNAQGSRIILICDARTVSTWISREATSIFGKAGKKLLYFDCSHIRHFLINNRPLTGIQRVTLNSLVGAWKRLGSGKVKALVFNAASASFLAIDVVELLQLGSSQNAVMQKCEFGDNDAVVLTEFLWDLTAGMATTSREHFGGARIFRLVYDVIPLSMPQLCPKSWRNKFRKFISSGIKNADFVMTISEFSKMDIEKHFPDECVKQTLTVLKLPHEFIGVHDMLDSAGLLPYQSSPNSIVSALTFGLEDEPFVLMVGTIDERKNQIAAIRAWNELCSRHGSKVPRLVFVGGLSSHSILFKMKMRYALRSAKKFLHLKKCNDLGLRWLYQHCQFSIFLSHYEGWGLPVGEGLWFGRPVVSSRSTSLPEVGEQFADYIDSESETSLLAGLERLLFDDNYRQSRSNQIGQGKFRTWDEFCERMLTSIDQLMHVDNVGSAEK